MVQLDVLLDEDAIGVLVEGVSASELMVVLSGWILARRPVFHVCQFGK